jgi:hypothetical protein
MELLFAALLIMIGFAVLGLAAIAFGVDSRDESTDPRRQPYPVGLD